MDEAKSTPTIYCHGWDYLWQHLLGRPRTSWPTKARRSWPTSRSRAPSSSKGSRPKTMSIPSSNQVTPVPLQGEGQRKCDLSQMQSAISPKFMKRMECTYLIIGFWHWGRSNHFTISWLWLSKDSILSWASQSWYSSEDPILSSREDEVWEYFHTLWGTSWTPCSYLIKNDIVPESHRNQTYSGSNNANNLMIHCSPIIQVNQNFRVNFVNKYNDLWYGLPVMSSIIRVQALDAFYAKRILCCVMVKKKTGLYLAIATTL